MSIPYEFLSHKKRKWWEYIYYPCWRVLWGGYRWYDGLLRPRKWWQNRIRAIWWFFHRGWYGWAPCDVWGLNFYLSGILAQTLRELVKCGSGYPGTIKLNEEFASQEEFNKFNIDRFETQEDWHKWLLDKADWFEWAYKDEDGHTGDTNWIEPGLSKEEIRKRIDIYIAKQEKFYKEVLPDFIKHWGNLWD